MSQTRLYLIRHGATAHNEMRPVVLQGNGLNGPLSERGQQQAADLGAFFKEREVHAIYASPMLRAQQTAQAVADYHGHDVQTLVAMHEVNVGAWEGMTWAQIMEAEPERYRSFMSDPYFPYLDGESYGDVLNRVFPVLESLYEKHRGESVVVVAHNVVNRVYLSHLLDQNLHRARKIRQMNCCINLIHHDDQPDLIAMNSVFHLREWLR